MASVAEVDEILTIDNGVKLYHVSYSVEEKRNIVSQTVENCSLHFFIESADDTPRIALIKCHESYFGLSHGKTVIFKCGKDGTYLFPDEKNQNAYNVLVITESTPELLDLFDGLLEYYSLLTQEPEWIRALPDDLTASLEQAKPTAPTEPTAEPSGRLYPDLPRQASEEEDIRLPESRAEIISNRMIEGAEMINTGIGYGSNFTSRIIKERAERYRNDRTTQMTEARVDPNVIRGLRGLRMATGVAASVTGTAATIVTTGTTYAANLLAPHVRHHGTRLVSHLSGKDYASSSQVMDNVFTVASGGLHGLGVLYNGLASGACSLARTVSDETVKVVETRYGREAAEVAKEALQATGNTIEATQNVRGLGPRSLVKEAAKQTGKQVVKGCGKG